MENRLSIKDLQKKRRQSLIVSEKAAQMHPDEYRAAREIARHVISSTIDISQYDQTAKKLARLLEVLMMDGSGSIFPYFHENIDPGRQGRPGYLRAMCIDLNYQMDCIDRIHTTGPRIIPLTPPGRLPDNGTQDT